MVRFIIFLKACIFEYLRARAQIVLTNGVYFLTNALFNKNFRYVNSVSLNLSL